MTAKHLLAMKIKGGLLYAKKRMHHYLNSSPIRQLQISEGSGASRRISPEERVVESESSGASIKLRIPRMTPMKFNY